MFNGQNDARVNGRKVGVTIPEAQRPQAADPNERFAPPQKMTNVLPCAMVLVRYGDKDGQAHQVCLLKVGDGAEARFFMPPNAEGWTKDLKPVAPWLAKQLAEELAQTEAPNDVPAGDAVEVEATPGV